MICKTYSFQKLNHFSQGNNVLDITASNTNGFLFRDTCVSLTQLNRICGTNKAYLNFEKLNLQESIPLKTISVLTGSQCA
jgi:hypothetical protein